MIYNPLQFFISSWNNGVRERTITRSLIENIHMLITHSRRHKLRNRIYGSQIMINEYFLQQISSNFERKPIRLASYRYFVLKPGCQYFFEFLVYV
jgi:hypothetical protein